MRIKTKRLKQKLRPIFDDPSKEFFQQHILHSEYSRRCVWRYNVILLCDNRAEFFPDYKVQDFPHVIFPSRRLFPKTVARWYFSFQYNRPHFHLIRQGKHKLRVVKYKPKKEKAADRPVDVSKLRCGDIIRHSDEGTILQVHHIDEKDLVHFIAYADRYDKYYTADLGEMQREPYRCTFGYIQDYVQATINEKTWLRKWIKQCKAGKIGHWIR